MPQVNKTVTIETPVTGYLCDWCGQEIGFTFFHPRSCGMCGRYACEEHHNGWWEESFGGDWPDLRCKECQDIGKPYLQHIEELEQATGEQMDAWRAAARANAAKQIDDLSKEGGA